MAAISDATVRGLVSDLADRTERTHEQLTDPSTTISTRARDVADALAGVATKLRELEVQLDVSS